MIKSTEDAGERAAAIADRWVKENFDPNVNWCSEWLRIYQEVLREILGG